MPVQRRSINIRSMLGTLAPEPSETSLPPPPPGFSQGDNIMKKRKRGEEQTGEASEERALSPLESSKAKAAKKGKSKNVRALQKATGHVAHKHKHRNDSKEPWSCEFYVEGRPVDEDDSVLKSKDVRGGQVADAVGRALLLPKDMKVWQEKRFEHMLENLKRDSILAVQGIFKAGSRLLETERLLNQTLEENAQLMDLEKTASTRIQAGESQHKSVEAGLKTAERQMVELQAKLDREYGTSAQLRGEANGPMDPESHETLGEPEATEDPVGPEAESPVPIVEVRDGEDGLDGDDAANVVD
uniref:Uncharacterized protein n=1 Tax=Fagus sylvatica TaxID=28930 RepID=A0A2N9HXZ6_FAGSY